MFPLEKIRVLDFAEAYSGPLATMMLGDMGAEVIKIERVQGEATRRRAGPLAMDDLDEAARGPAVEMARFLAINRSKRSLALDIRHPRGKEVVLKLVPEADVFFECFRPGVMDRLGLGYEVISEINPRVIYVSLTGWGEKGPYAHRIGADLWAQAIGGVVAYQGEPGGPPFLAGCQFIDQGTAALSVFGIMTALFVRERTGIGQRVSLNLLHSVIHMQSVETSEYLINGKLVTKVGRGMEGRVPGGAYRAQDGDVVSIYGIGPQWPAFCRVLGLPDLIDDPRFSTDEERFQHRQELYPILDRAFSQRTRAQWQQAFKEARMRVEPCLDHQELFAHPQVEENEMVVTVEHATRGPIRTIAPPVKLSKTPARPQSAPPLLGQHTREILLELGYTSAEIDELEGVGVINTGGKGP